MGRAVVAWGVGHSFRQLGRGGASTSVEQIREASHWFYAALKRVIDGDDSRGPDVWPHRSDVFTMHPVGGEQAGRDAVHGGLKMPARAIHDRTDFVGDPELLVLGDVAYTNGIENASACGAPIGASVSACSTTIHRFEGDTWKTVHHTCSVPVPLGAPLRRIGQGG